VERPLLDALGAHRADPDEQAHMLGDRRLADPQLLRDQQAADAVLDQIAVDLLAEMRARRLEPFEDLQAPFAGEGAEGGRGMHLGNCLITVFSPACEAMQHIIDRALIDQTGIAATERLIRPYIRHTPVIRIDAGDLGIAGEPLVLKLEFLQHTGSFKPRGAFASLLTQTAPEAGVVAASGGNHGVAVAYAAMRLGLRATIFAPNVASPAKLERIRFYGAELVVGIAHRRRAGRRRRAGGADLRPLSAGAGRARCGPAVRRQYHRRRFRAELAEPVRAREALRHAAAGAAARAAPRGQVEFGA